MIVYDETNKLKINNGPIICLNFWNFGHQSMKSTFNYLYICLEK